MGVVTRVYTLNCLADRRIELQRQGLVSGRIATTQEIALERTLPVLYLCDGE